MTPGIWGKATIEQYLETTIEQYLEMRVFFGVGTADYGFSDIKRGKTGC